MADQQQLAEQQRTRQGLIAAALTRDLARLLRALFNPASPGPSWQATRTAAAAMIRNSRGNSADIAALFYQEARRAAGAGGRLRAAEPIGLPEDRLLAHIDATGIGNFSRSIRAGATPAQAVDRAAVGLSGSGVRLALEGGRSVIDQTSQDDPEAIGWIRVTDADPCSWCAMLASRGAVYHSAQTAGGAQNARFIGDGQFKFHDHCVPAGTLVDGPSAEIGYRRDYQGELVIIGTAAGHELRITPNHPVLTDRGWIPAGLVSEGDDVVSGLNAQGNLLAIPNEQHVPALAEDIWRALSMLGLVCMPGTTEDFHGDGADREVDVVGTDRFLRSDGGIIDVLHEAEFAFGGVTKSSLAFLSAQGPLFQRDITASDRIMGGARNRAAFFRSTTTRGKDRRLTGVTQPYGPFDEASPDYGSRDAISSGEREFTFSSLIRLADLLDGDLFTVRSSEYAPLSEFAAKRTLGNTEFRFDLPTCFSREIKLDSFIKCRAVEPSVTRFNPTSEYGSPDGAGAYARLGVDLMKRLAGQVKLDSVIDVRRREFSGHVYNFQTVAGWYRANGIIVSNCGCVAAPVFAQDDPLLTRADELYGQWREVTAGHSGQDAINAWRRHWENRETTSEGAA